MYTALKGLIAGLVLGVSESLLDAGMEISLAAGMVWLYERLHRPKNWVMKRKLVHLRAGRFHGSH